VLGPGGASRVVHPLRTVWCKCLHAAARGQPPTPTASWRSPGALRCHASTAAVGPSAAARWPGPVRAGPRPGLGRAARA